MSGSVDRQHSWLVFRVPWVAQYLSRRIIVASIVVHGSPVVVYVEHPPDGGAVPEYAGWFVAGAFTHDDYLGLVCVDASHSLLP